MALTPIGINTSISELNDFEDSLSYVSSAIDVPFTRNYSLASNSTFLPIQTHIKVEINTKEPTTKCLVNESGEILHNTLTVDEQNNFEINLNNTNDLISPNTGLTNLSTDSSGRGTRHSARQQQIQQEKMERKRKQEQQLQTLTTRSVSRSSSTSKKSNSISPKVDFF